MYEKDLSEFINNRTLIGVIIADFFDKCDRIQIFRHVEVGYVFPSIE